MARATSGSLLGRAASTELSELREQAYEEWVKQERAKLVARENELLDTAVGMPGFTAFWVTVPVFGKRQDRIARLEDFIAGTALGTHYTISAGEVLELDAHLESRYDEQTEEDMLF